MIPIALDPDFESLAETLTSLSLDLDDSNPIDNFLREAAQAASLAKEQSLAQRRRQSQPSQPHLPHRSLQQVLYTTYNTPKIHTSPPPGDVSGSSTPSSNMMDLSPISPVPSSHPQQFPQLSYAQAAQKRIQALKSPSQQELISHLPTCLHKRPREVDYTSTFRFVKLWFRDGHWSDNLEPTWRKDAPKMPNIPKLIASLRRRKSDATMVSTISSSCSNSVFSDSDASDSDTETEGELRNRLRRRDRDRQRDRERDREREQTPMYLTPQKGKQPKTYRSSSNLYELPAGVAPEKSPLAYTPSNLGNSRLKSLEDEEEPLEHVESDEREVGEENGGDSNFTVPKLRKRPGTKKLSDRGAGSGRNSPAPTGAVTGGENAGVGGAMPFWMPMGHTNGPSVDVRH